MRASGAATPTAGEAGKTGYPQKPVFASADAKQRYRWVPDPTWPQLSRLSRHARGHAVEDTASLTGRKFVAEKYGCIVAALKAAIAGHCALRCVRSQPGLIPSI